MKTIVFQGDSITDCGRNINNGSTMSIGQSYSMLVASKLMYENPGEFEFINKGVSGNRIVDIYSRIEADCWNHNPDVLSILAGINDVWHEICFKNGVSLKRYEKIYSLLIEDTLELFPDIKILLLEPFVLKGSATEENWDTFNTETHLRAETVQKLADKYNLIFVPLQKKFDEAEKIYPQPYWLADGVHPFPAGHQLIADAWIEAYNKYIK